MRTREVILGTWRRSSRVLPGGLGYYQEAIGLEYYQEAIGPRVLPGGLEYYQEA